LKYKINSGVIASQSVYQSMNIRLINKRNISIFCRLVIGTVTVTVQWTANKRKHWKYWLKYNWS